MNADVALETLRQRRDYLAGRIRLKTEVGWESTYDQREHDALDWALGRLG